MTKHRHGRRNTSAAEDELNTSAVFDSNNGCMFKLPLRNVEDPEELSKKLTPQIVQTEYTTRYLESIGVTPSKATAEIVKKNVPLTDKHIKVTLRARGFVEDELQVKTPPIKYPYKAPVPVLPTSMVQVGILNTIKAPPNEAYVLGIVGSEDPAVLSTQNDGPEKMNLTQMCSRFLYPFNLDDNMAKQRQESLTQMGRHMIMGPWGGGEEDYDCDGMLAELEEELMQEFVCGPEVVLALLTPFEAALQDWYTGQAPETLRGKLTKLEFDETLNQLMSDPLIILFITTCYYMYEEFIRNSPAYPFHLVGQAEGGGSPITGLYGGGSASSVVAHKTRRRAQIRQMLNREKWDLGYSLLHKFKPSVPGPINQAPQAPNTAPSSVAGSAAGSVAGDIPPRRGRSSRSSRPSSAAGSNDSGGSMMSKAASQFSAASGASRMSRGGMSYASGYTGISGDVGRDTASSLRNMHMSADTAQLQSNRLYAMQTEFASLMDSARQSRAGMFFSLPILLLALRLVVDRLFTTVFRMFSKTRAGIEALALMDRTLLDIYDPHMILSKSLSIIQSSPAAVTCAQKNIALSHEAERVHFNDTSPVVRTALAYPSSAGARKLLNTMYPKRAPPSYLAAGLSLAQRDAMFRQIATTGIASGRRRHNPDLRQLGEEMPTDRGKWMANQAKGY